MKYTEILNRRLKKAGREYRTGNHSDKKERLWNAIQEIMEEAEGTGSFLPWTQAVQKLKLNEQQQMLIAVLWGTETYGDRLSVEEFRRLWIQIYEEEPENMKALPVWYYFNEEYVELCPVLSGWLEGTMPVLPSGVQLRLTEEKKSYGLEELLAESHRIFSLAEQTGDPMILCLTGAAGSGREYAMEQICAGQNLALLLIDGETFRGTERELNACILSAMLYEAYPCVWLGKTERWELLEKIRESFSFYGVIREEGRALAERPEASVITRKLEQPDRKLKQQMAEELLGDLADRLPEDISLAHLAGRQLPMGDYLRYLKTIRTELLADSFHEQTWNLPSDSLHLQLLTGNRRFSELKLPKPQYEQLRRICRMVEAREEVMEQWGFGRKFSYGNGISVLFYGAPGTGKTMAAQVLATELGRPLYRVDLSQLISKYIGETQKNIGKVFDEADRCDCILLFDEADAIFTRRSDVSDAQDRYSNAETAYLLQRIEQYAGISVLATNLLQNFDEAFRRRISYMVHFPMPDASLRKELWEEIFPTDTPVDPEVDTCMLAQAFEISGAAIKNAAMHGALEAASEHSPVKMKHLLAGIQNEYSKQGRNFSAAQKELLEAFL